MTNILGVLLSRYFVYVQDRSETYVQVPGLLDILADQSFLHVLKRADLGPHVLGPVAGLLQQTHQSVRLLGVVVDHIHGAAVALTTSDCVCFIGFPFDGVVVAVPGMCHRECEAPEIVSTLP